MQDQKDIKKTTYKDYAEKRASPSPLIRDTFLAFIFGGALCVAGQGLTALFLTWTGSESTAGTLASLALIAIASLLTGFGVFDKAARYGGAGMLVPITGFSNAMTSPAIDAKSEGWVLGVGAKIFNVAGPVILYGTLSSAVYGLIYYVLKTLIL